MKRGSTKAVLLFVLMNIGLFALWIGLTYQISSSKERYLAAAAPLMEESGKESYVTMINRSFRETEKDVALLDHLIVERGDEAKFLEQVESLRGASGASMTIASFEERGGVLRLSIRASGTFTQVYHLLSLLEAMPFGVSVERFTLSESLTSEKQVLWAGVFELSLKNYYISN